MTLSPKILAALKKVDDAHAALFAALEEEARRERLARSGRKRAAPTRQSTKRGALQTPRLDSLPGGASDRPGHPEGRPEPDSQAGA
jgi:hypothetical protein